MTLFSFVLHRVERNATSGNYNPINELRKELPVYARLGSILSGTASPDELDELDSSLKDTVVNVKWLSHHRSVARLKKVFCRGTVIPMLRYPKKHYPK